MKVNNKLKEIRNKVGLTQEQLAAAIGSSKSYISQLESGARNIRQIRTDTMQRLCAVLNCTADDLMIDTDFEFNEDGKLIVDGLYYDKRLPNNFVAEIDGEYFLTPSLAVFAATKDSKSIQEQLRPMATKVAVSAMPLGEYVYPMLNCVPRQGFTIELLRAITAEEFEELVNRFNLTEEDISGEFVSEKGGFYGKSAKKTFTAKQIRVENGQAIPLEEELRNKGIEAANIAPGRVNIRVD